MIELNAELLQVPNEKKNLHRYKELRKTRERQSGKALQSFAVKRIHAEYSWKCRKLHILTLKRANCEKIGWKHLLVLHSESEIFDKREFRFISGL